MPREQIGLKTDTGKARRHGCTYKDYRTNRCPDQPVRSRINFWDLLMNNPSGAQQGTACTDKVPPCIQAPPPPPPAPAPGGRGLGFVMDALVRFGWDTGEEAAEAVTQLQHWVLLLLLQCVCRVGNTVLAPVSPAVESCCATH